MKELEELTREIWEKLPRLTILECGQEIKALIDDPLSLIEKGQSYIIGYEDCNIYAGHSIEIGGYVYNIGNDFEIVGLSPMLNDVLEALHNESVHESLLSIDTRGTIHQYSYKFECFCPLPFKWDLSKPFLKDQSPELINFLNGLIKTR